MALKLGGLFRKLTGAGEAAEGSAPPQTKGPAVEYNGYTIHFTPHKDGGHFLTAGLIAKDFPEGAREQSFIRAETHPSEDAARDFAIIKAKQIIDEQGDRLFKDATPKSDEPSD